MGNKKLILTIRPKAVAVNRDGDWSINDNHTGKVISTGKSERQAWNAARILLWKELVRYPGTKRQFDDISKRVKVFERDGWKCIKCGCTDIEALTIDHLMPKSKGGTNDEWNMATMCANCNKKKANKIVQKYIDLMHKQWKSESCTSIADAKHFLKIKNQ